jgi:protein-disulfide isomerase/uncharacterized membrane protein YphA (DoxX/SURF4 family)
VRWDAIRPWLGTVVRLVLGVVWIWAAWSKLHSPRTFVQAVRAYDATPEWLSKAIGYGLPVLEVSIGILLIVGVAVRLAAIVSAVLLVVFMIAIIQAAARDIQLDCGCFGGGGTTTSTSYTLDILRDIGLLILAAYLVVWSFTRISIEEFIARNDYVEAPSAKRLRTDKGARKYNAMLEARRKEARSRTLYLNGSLAIVVVLVALIGVGVQSGRAKIEGSLSAPHASVANGVVFGKKAAATVDVYEDFQCPHCLDFEKSVSKTMEADVRANKAQVRYHPLAFLDSASDGNRYSSRAANAALCASDVSVETFVKFHDILFGTYKGKQVQPAENSGGRPDGDFVRYGQTAGITGAKLTTFTQCVQDEKHKALVQAITDSASQHGVTATPTIKVNGKTIGADLASYKKAVAAALAKGPAPNPSKTPSPTPSATSSKSGTPTATPTKKATSSSKAP